MEKLNKMNLLAGQTETITLMDFRKTPGEIIAQVQLGKTFVITKAGKPVATIHQPEPDIFEVAAAARAAR